MMSVPDVARPVRLLAFLAATLNVYGLPLLSLGKVTVLLVAVPEEKIDVCGVVPLYGVIV